MPVEAEPPRECGLTQLALEGALARVCLQVAIHAGFSLSRIRAQPAGMQAALHGHK